jgi:hypothetical protein
MCLRLSYKKKMNFFCILKAAELDPDPDPLVRGVDPDPHQNVTDPQHWRKLSLFSQEHHQ